MKNTTKTLLLMLGLAVLAPMKALAGPAEDSQVKLDTARSFWYEVRANSSPFVNLYYVGSASQAIVHVDADSIEAEAPFATDDTGFGTSGSYDLTAAAYDTMGELCDAIDLLADYGCELTGAKRDDSSVLLRDRVGLNTDNLKAAGGFDVNLDTGSTIVGVGSWSVNTYDLRLGLAPSDSTKSLVLKECEVNANGATDYRVFGKSARYDINSRPNARKPVSITDTTEVWREVIADDTAESYDWTPASAMSAGDGWQFARGAHVVVSAGNSTNVQAPANFLRCLFEER